MIDYPNKLQKIFDKLSLNGMKIIIVGGYVRDKILKIESKDIDIELYGLDSLDSLEKLLDEFGSPNSVGKSFGVVKLNFKGYELDFSLPRKDNKVGVGHKGFVVTTEKNMDFTTAASRRDFTINAMGYDVNERKFFDPYGGLEDLRKGILRAVDLKKFDEDPLRVLRGIGFSARFCLTFEKELFTHCTNLIASGVLCELASERIFEELQKMLLKSPKPSLALLQLQALGAFHFFSELNSLTQNQFRELLEALDRLHSIKTQNDKEKILLALTLLVEEFTEEKMQTFLDRITKERTLIKEVKHYAKLLRKEFKEPLDDPILYRLAKESELRLFFILCQAKQKFSQENLESYKKRAKSLNILRKPLPALIGGQELINLGLKPSQEFKTILSKAYNAQIEGVFSAKEEALKWLEYYLSKEK